MTAASAGRFAEPVSFYAEGNRTHVVLTIHDYDENLNIEVRISKTDLLKMADAEPAYTSAGITQTCTPPLAAGGASS